MSSNYKISTAKLIILFIIASLSFISCSKDNDQLVDKVAKSALNLPINLEEAKEYYQKNIKNGNENVSESFDGNFDSFTDLEPLWNLSSKVYNNAGNELLLVPVAYNSGISDPTIGVQYVFFNSAACGGLTCEIIFYKPEYIPGLSNIERTSSFTGAVTTFSFCSCQFNAFIGKEGEFYFLESKDSLDEGVSNNTASTQSRDGGDPGCYNFNGTFWSRLGDLLSRIGNKFVDFFDSGGGGGGSAGSGGSPTSYPGSFSSSGFPGFSGNGDGDGSGGGGGLVIINGFDLSNYLNSAFFRGYEGIIKWNLNEIISNNNLFVCVNDVHDELFMCLQHNSGNLNMGCPISDQTGVLNASCYSQMLSMLDPSHTCLNQLILNHQITSPQIEFGDGELICAIEEANTVGISNEVLFSILNEKCTNDFECKNTLINCLHNLSQIVSVYNLEIHLGAQELEYLFGSDISFCEIANGNSQYIEEVLMLFSTNFTHFCFDVETAPIAGQILDNLEQNNTLTLSSLNQEIVTKIECNCPTSSNICLDDEIEDEGTEGICPSTFILTPVGNGYTTQVNNIQFTYKGQHKRVIHIGNLCIQVTNKNSSGQNLSPSQVSSLLADCFAEAQTFMASSMATSNHFVSSYQLQRTFIDVFKYGITSRFNGSFLTGSLSLSNSNCLGNIASSSPVYSFLCD